MLNILTVIALAVMAATILIQALTIHYVQKTIDQFSKILDLMSEEQREARLNNK